MTSSPSLRGRMLLLCALVLVATDLALCGTRFWQNTLLAAIQQSSELKAVQHGANMLGSLQASEDTVSMLSAANTVAYAALLVACACWSYAVVKQFRERGKADFYWSPRDAAIAWFIPLINLFRPFYLFSAMVRYSRDPALPKAGQRRMVPAVTCWWLGTLALAAFSAWLKLDDPSASEALTRAIQLNHWKMLADLCEAVSLIAFTTTVLTILRNWRAYLKPPATA